MPIKAIIWDIGGVIARTEDLRPRDQLAADLGVTRDHLNNLFFSEISKIPNVEILHDLQLDRLCIVSFYVPDIHFNLIVRLLSDRFGIQTRGGCSCAGTYGHLLLGVDEATSEAITCQIDEGDLSQKPGWVRVSLHPTTTNAEVITITNAIKEVINNIKTWEQDYQFDPQYGDFFPKKNQTDPISLEDFDCY